MMMLDAISGYIEYKETNLDMEINGLSRRGEEGRMNELTCQTRTTNTKEGLDAMTHPAKGRESAPGSHRR